MIYVLLGFATWRISKLLSFDYGPYHVLESMRCALGVRYDEDGEPYGTNVLSEMVLCTYCNTVWVGTFLCLLYALLGNFAQWIILPFALSGMAVILEEAFVDG